MIPADKIETAHATDIVAVARRYTTLKRSGTEWIGPCPVCGGRDRFGVSVRKRVFNCRGCGGTGDVIALVQHASGVSFAEAIAELTGERGDADNVSIRPRAPDPPPAIEDDAERTRRALRIWHSALAIRGTLAETYLRRRHVDIDAIPDLDDVLRFAPRCLFGDERRPCVVALVRNIVTNEPVAIQRTALDVAAVLDPATDPDKLKIGRLSLGPTKGGAIKLWPDEAVTTGLVVGEGMETVASAALGITHKGTLLQPAWALLDRGNLKDLPVLAGIEVLTILVDNDESGDGQADAETCARRWIDAGRDVIRLTPKKRGSDFNDIAGGV